MSLIAYQQVSSGSPVSALNFTSFIDNTSNYFQLIFESVNVISPSSTDYMIAQISDDLGSTWKTSGYYNNLLPSVTSGFVLGITHDSGTGFTYVIDGTVNFNNIYWGTGQPMVVGMSNSFAGTGPVISAQQPSGAYTTAPIVGNAIRIKSSNGLNFYGNFYLYGN